MGFKEETTKPIWGSVSHTSSSSSYALNGKIMLTSVIILSVAIIMILCFHTYARWLFRRQNRRIRRRIRAHLRSLSSTISSSSLSPLDPSVLEKIPIFVYSSETHELEECSVCLSEFEQGDEARLLPKCSHAFHVECIDTWFRSRSTCPLCRAPVQSESESPVKPVEDLETETGSSSSSSSSPLRFPMEACERTPIDLVGVTVEIPNSNPVQTGSKSNQVLSLKRLWNI